MISKQTNTTKHLAVDIQMKHGLTGGHTNHKSQRAHYINNLIVTKTINVQKSTGT